MELTFTIALLATVSLCGCGGKLGLADLEGKWTEVPLPKEWLDHAGQADYAKILAGYEGREHDVLIFKGNTLTTISARRTIVREFDAPIARNDGAFTLAFHEKVDSIRTAKFRIRDGRMEFGFEKIVAEPPAAGEHEQRLMIVSVLRAFERTANQNGRRQ